MHPYLSSWCHLTHHGLRTLRTSLTTHLYREPASSSPITLNTNTYPSIAPSHSGHRRPLFTNQPPLFAGRQSAYARLYVCLCILLALCTVRRRSLFSSAGESDAQPRHVAHKLRSQTGPRRPSRSAVPSSHQVPCTRPN